MYIYTMYIFKKKKINIYTGLLQVNLSCSMQVSSIEYWGRCGFYVQSYCFAQLCEGNEFEECTCPMFFWFLSNWIHVGIKWKCKWFTNCIYMYLLKISNFIHEIQMNERIILVDLCENDLMNKCWLFYGYQRFYTLLRMEALYLKLCTVNS